jgi:hypothetical protein
MPLLCREKVNADALAIGDALLSFFTFRIRLKEPYTYIEEKYVRKTHGYD